MKKLPIHVKIVIGLVLGIVWAFLSSFMGWNEFTIRWIDPFGMIFIRLLKFIAVPLVLFSIIGGVSGLRDVSKLGRLGWKTLLAYMTTTLLAVGIGLTLVNIVKPGTHIDDEQRIKNRLSYEVWLQENDIGATQDGLNFLSDPKYAAYLSEAQAAEQVTSPKLDLEKKMKTVAVQKESSPLKFIVEMVPDNIFASLSGNGLMLQVIFFAIFFGITLVLIPEEASVPIINLVNGMNSIFLKMVDLVMKAAPFFVFCLLAGVVAKMADSPQEVFEIFIGLGSYSLTLFSGLFLLTFVVYPLIVKSLVSKMSFKDFFKNISPAQFLAFSTSSSAATLPVTMECVEENVGVPKSISSFVLPIGATVNMDGTSMFEGVAVVFLAQLHFIDLTIAQQLTIVFTAAAASIGSAAVPSAGLIMMIMVLQSVGLNPAWVAIIFPVDRILDMCRTVVNVTGDMVVSTLIAKSEGELEKYS
ncbi:dicarboxylate/amino acid:cation symporter [Cyclobacteriaceae bacterium]|nr:dicarboxylate/amino acid:cation symporter [Cyclobacteriaceae bacterium]MDB4316054.1 dicarboxylate/amino acid:cation symporter [Cyclobacteriaceae bacterium]MDB4603276.1 dicarboxylate/amino acid:cation symporter [Cyclobacteriaceae bacterium]MDB4741990.1 dicarboxylate/amino acid:cation symporter [Cyclobacteriaceae bacterium]